MSGMSLSFLLHVAPSVHQPNSHLQKAAGAWGKVPHRQPWGTSAYLQRLSFGTRAGFSHCAGLTPVAASRREPEGRLGGKSSLHSLCYDSGLYFTCWDLCGI